MVLDNIIRGSNIRKHVVIYNCKHKIIGYANDIAIIARSKKELESIFGLLETNLRKMISPKLAMLKLVCIKV